MSFFGLQSGKKGPRAQSVSTAFLHRHECQVCPLNNQPSLKHPNMEPTGSSHPVIYMMAEAPGAVEDAKGVQLVGPSGRILRNLIPNKWLDKIRWNNTVRCRPPENRTPTQVELECCRPSVQRDISASKPKAIFGFGAIPLQWALDQTGISKWNGRKIPVKIGDHSCWYFPMLHPAYILHLRKDSGKGSSDIEFVFELDLRNAFNEIESLPDPIVHTREDAEADIECITGSGGESDVVRLNEFLESIWDDPLVGLDYETNALRPYGDDAKILTVALSGRDKTFAFPLYHSGGKWRSNAQLEAANDSFQYFLYNAKCRKVAHQLPFEMEWSAFFYGNEVLRAGKWGDSVSQGYILDHRSGCHSLEFLCIQYFGLNVKALSNVVDKARLDEMDLEKVLFYNAIDSKYHRLLYAAQARRVKDEGLSAVYQHQLRRIPTLVLTQIKGIPIDQDTVNKFYDDLNKRLQEVEDDFEMRDEVHKFKRKFGHTFSASSHHDITKMFRDILGIYDIEGTDEKILSKIDHPMSELVLKWRDASKQLSTYVKPLMSPETLAARKEDPSVSALWPDGLVHTVLNTSRTRTWRTSSDSVNIQNYPKRDNKEIRRQVKAADRNIKVVAFDYAGIQARNIAMESKDKALVEAFWNKYDVHTDWLERLLKRHPQFIAEGLKSINGSDKTSKDLRKAYRNRAKNEFVFPSFFGAQPKSIAEHMKIPERVAAALSEEFWNEFPDIKDWHENVKKLYIKNGYVTGLSGFRRRAPVGHNEIINTPIQSDESIIVCGAMIRLSELGDDRFQANMEIHDDLTFFWPKNEIEYNAEVVIREMLHIEFNWINVPLVVEASVGDNWCDLEAIGEFSSENWNGHVKLPAPEKRKPAETDTWADGTGWSNADGMEKAGRRRK